MTVLAFVTGFFVASTIAFALFAYRQHLEIVDLRYVHWAIEEQMPAFPQDEL